MGVNKMVMCLDCGNTGTIEELLNGKCKCNQIGTGCFLISTSIILGVGLLCYILKYFGGI